MKLFIFLLLMTICMGVANANSSYQASHDVTEQAQIIQPPSGYEFEFIAPVAVDCYFESNTDNIKFSRQFFDFVIFAKIPYCTISSLHRHNPNYCANINHYSGYLPQCFTNIKYRSCPAWINNKKNFRNHYSG